MTENSGVKKAGALFKKTETAVWRALEPVGRGANKLAGRMGVEGFWPTELDQGELDKAARILRTFTLDGVQADDGQEAEQAGGVLPEQQQQQQQQQHKEHQSNATSDKYASRKTQKVIRKIPPKVLQEACGIAIMTAFRTGFQISAASGSGVVLARLPDGSWGPPSGLLVHTIGFGFLIGIDVYDCVLVLRKQSALQAFQKPKISIGGELSVAAGPVGNGAMLESAVQSAAPCWSYTKSKGAYAGVQLDGTVILKRDDANARFYGRKVSSEDLLNGRVDFIPKHVHPLWQTLYAAEGRSHVLGTSSIPQGLAPGEMEVPQDGDEKQISNGHAASTSVQPSRSSTRHFVPPPPPSNNAKAKETLLESKSENPFDETQAQTSVVVNPPSESKVDHPPPPSYNQSL